jgi:YkoY family integral membrane protein
MEITSNDFALIGLLVFLEGILSVDNALVLAILAKHLPRAEQKKALSYGLIGAFIFRFAALAMVSFLVKWAWVKYVGGAYLIYIAVKHLFFPPGPARRHSKAQDASFWRTVVAIELTDVAFAIDSILAGIALTPKLWIVFTGGILGVVLMRFAASAFIRLIDRFPRLEKSAYLLVFMIGTKVIIEAIRLPGVDFHSPKMLSFWIFWVLMLAGISYGFMGKPKAKRG